MFSRSVATLNELLSFASLKIILSGRKPALTEFFVFQKISVGT